MTQEELETATLVQLANALDTHKSRVCDEIINRRLKSDRNKLEVMVKFHFNKWLTATKTGQDLYQSCAEFELFKQVWEYATI